MTTFSLPPPSQDFIGKGKTISEPWYRVFLRFVADFLTEVVEDTSPQLGGDLDTNGFDLNGADTSLTLGGSFTTNISGTRVADVFDVGSNSLGCLVVKNSSPGNGPGIITYAQSATPAANDIVGYIDFIGKNSAGSEEFYGVIHCVPDDVTDTSEDSHLSFGVMDAGTLRTVAEFNMGGTTLFGTGSYPAFTLEASNVSPEIHLQGAQSGSDLGGVLFYGWNSTPAQMQMGYMYGQRLDNTAGSEDSLIYFNTRTAGADLTQLNISNGVSIGAWATPGRGNLALSTGQAFTSLPASPTKGMIAVVTDSNTATWGATIAGSGANSVLAWYNGTNWTVIGA